MDEFDVAVFGYLDNGVDIEIGGYGAFASGQQVSFISFESMNAEAIFVGIKGDRATTEFRGAPENADGDFTSIGGEEFFHMTVISDGWELKLGYREESRRSRRYFARIFNCQSALLDLG